MARKLEGKKQYTADFETTSEENFNRDGFTRVWLAQLRDISNDNVEITTNNIDDFMSHITRFKKSCDIYFHNLKFDGSFIIDWLLKSGWAYSETPETGTFNSIITGQGLYYMITLTIKKQGKKTIKIDIYDSLKKIPFSEAKISKAFKLGVSKGSIDYEMYRPLDYQPTKEEIDYISDDTLIMSRALRLWFSRGLTKMTVGSDAKNAFLEMIGEKKHAYYFPILDLEMDEAIRPSYKGGWVYLNPKYKAVELGTTTSYDVNSLYPWAMYDNLLPYGVPLRFEGKYQPNKDYPLYVQYIEVNFKLKKGKLPTIQIKNTSRFVSTEYLTTSKGEMVILCLTNIDLQLFFDHYDVKEINYISGYMFRGVRGLFKKFIDFYMRIKETTEGAEREQAKLMLNNLYGKYGTNPKRDLKIPFIKNGVVKYNTIDQEPKNTGYIPMASFITAYSRDKTIRSAQDNYNRFIYADTDSIHLVGDEVPDNLEIHNTHLGAWKCEGVTDKAKFLRAKTYFKIKDGEVKITCAGMPQVVKDSIKDINVFKEGATFEGKLASKVVNGGTVLLKTTFKIKIDKKNIVMYNDINKKGGNYDTFESYE